MAAPSSGFTAKLPTATRHNPKSPLRSAWNMHAPDVVAKVPSDSPNMVLRFFVALAFGTAPLYQPDLGLSVALPTARSEAIAVATSRG